MPKKFNIKFHTIFEKKYHITDFKNKLFSFLIITEEIFNYFEMAISLIFLDNLVYTIKEVTRIATVSDYQLINLYSIGVNALQICSISYFADAVCLKVRY